MPKLGLTMTEGTVAEWLVAPGAALRGGANVLLIESDKVVVEVPAPCDGTLVEIVAQVGDVVAVGAVVGYIDTQAAASGAGSAAPAAAPAPVEPAAPAVLAAPAPAAPAAAAGGRIVASPLARKLAQRLSVALAGIAGSGPRGRIVAADVQAAAARRTEAPVAAPAPAPAPGALVRPSSLQATMARRLTAAKQQIPHFYLAAEAEVSRLLELRRELNAAGQGPRLTLSHLVVAAVARALRELPLANRVWTDEGIQAFDCVDVGVAVSSERGLLVPVVRGIGEADLASIARRTSAVVERARTGALTPQDMGGGAITVSNAGMYEVSWMTPIINPGQAMILGVGSVRELFRPDAQGQPALRREIGLVLAADHRLIDGVAALGFLNRVIAHLRDPLSLLYGAGGDTP